MAFPAVSGELSAYLRAAAYALLLFTPGAWITCGLDLTGIPFWARISAAALLSPLVVCIEFYAIRLGGAPFSTTAVLLVVLNLPALYLIWRRRRTPASLTRGEWLMGAAAIAIPAVFMSGMLLYPGARLFAPHGWYHADTSYMLARGQLVLESPTLAGIRLSYPPWGPLVLPAVQSYLVQSPPVSSYIWGDLLWFILFFAFGAGIAAEMGGRKLAQVSTGLWLIVGWTPVGYLILKRWPGGVLGYCCDSRYIEAINKFELFGPMALGLAMLMALIYFVIRSGPMNTRLLTVIFLLLTGLGVLYPLLFPPACCVIGARALALLMVEGRRGQGPAVRKEWLSWACVLLVAGALTYAGIKFLMVDRHTAEKTLSVSGKGFAARKLLAALVVTPLFFGGWLFALRWCWDKRRTATLILSIAAAASYLLYAVFHVPFYDNEYKFVFAAVMCLAVFPGIAVERIWTGWPRKWSVPALTALGVFVLGTYAHFAWTNWPAPWALPRPGLAGQKERLPLLDTSGFFLHLDRREPWSAICDAVFQLTPPDTVLVLDDGTFYYPGLTARSLYVSMPERPFSYSGVNVGNDSLDADLRGYGREILAERRATQADLFSAIDCCRRESALDRILALKRPVAVITEEPRHAGLAEWLKHQPGVTKLYAGNNLTLWLIHAASSAGHPSVPGS